MESQDGSPTCYLLSSPGLLQFLLRSAHICDGLTISRTISQRSWDRPTLSPRLLISIWRCAYAARQCLLHRTALGKGPRHFAKFFKSSGDKLTCDGSVSAHNLGSVLCLVSCASTTDCSIHVCRTAASVTLFQRDVQMNAAKCGVPSLGRSAVPETQ